MENFEKQIADCPEAFFPAVEFFLPFLCRESSAPETLADAKSFIKNKGMELNRLLVQCILNRKKAEEEKRERLVGSDGEVRARRHVDKPRQIETLFGEVELRRIGHRGHGLDILYPLDAELNPPPGKYSGPCAARSAAWSPGSRSSPRRTRSAGKKAASSPSNKCGR